MLWNKIILLVLLIIPLVFLTLFPRSVEVLNGNYLFGFDQGREYMMTKRIVVDRKVTLVGTELGAGSAGISGIFHGPMYYYFLAIPFLLLNGDPYGGVVMMFLFSIATVIFSYVLGRALFGNIFGLLVALFVAASPPFISQARFLWSPNLPSLFILLAFYCVFRMKEKRFLYIFWAAFFSAFTYNFEFAIAVPMSIGLFLYTFFIVKLRDVKQYAALFLGFLAGFLPMILFEIRHGFMALRGFLGYLFGQKAVSSSGLPFIELVDNRFDFFVFNFFDTFPKEQLLPLLLIAVIFFLGVYFLRREKVHNVKQFLRYLLLLIPVNFFVFLLLRTPVYHYYLTDLNFVYIFIVVYLLYYLYKEKHTKYLMVTAMVLIFILLPSIPNAFRTSVKDYYDYGGIAKNRGIRDAIDFIYRDAKGRQFNLLIFAPPVYTHQYDYMLWWYAQRKYGYVPTNEKKDTFYLLIEPDPAKPWSYKGWLETVIKTGKIVKTQTLPSGFIVQKREAE